MTRFFLRAEMSRLPAPIWLASPVILDYFIHVATWQPWLSVSDCCRILELTGEGGGKRGLRKGGRPNRCRSVVRSVAKTTPHIALHLITRGPKLRISDIVTRYR